MAQIIRKNPSMLEQMKKSSCLSGVKKDTIRKIYDLGRVRQYNRGEPVIHAREKFPFICFLLSGKVIEYNLTHLGKRKILYIFGPGSLLNDHVVDDHVSTIYCDTLEACTILLIPQDIFLELMEEDYSLVQGIMRDQENKIRRLIHQLKNSVGNIYMDRRMASKLWKLARDFGIPKDNGVEIDVNISVTLLADMLGAPRETASRLLKDLTNYGLIRHERKRIFIYDVDKLVHFFKTGEVE